MEQLRTEGNALFSSKKFTEAIEKYTKGLDLSSDNEPEDVQAQRCILWSNRAACHLQMENFREALKDCTSVLDIEANNEKARYRRAQAHVGLGNLTEAFQDVRLVLQLNSSNKAAIALARKIKDSVQADVHGLQKAFETINKCFEKNECGWIREKRKQTEEALKFLEMKCFSDLSSIPAEIESKGGFTVIWHALKTLITLFSTVNTSKTKNLSLLTDLLGVVLGLLGVLASSSIQMARGVYQTGESEVLRRIVCLLHEEIAKEYKASSDGTQKHLNTVICKSIVKLLALSLKALLLDAGEPDASGLVHSEDIRHIFEGMLNGLRSQHDELRMSCLDGILHSLASPPGANDKILINQAEISKRKAGFASIAHGMGIFQLLHSTAASSNASDVVLSRIPLVFSQFLMQFESKEKELEQVVLENCVQPVLKAKASDVGSLRQATASCLILSGLFLTNAKLALWAIKQTANDGTRFLSCVHEFLLASRQTIDGLCTEEKGLMQEIWMDCIASVCGTDGGTACVPAPLRVDILKLLHTTAENSVGNKSSRAKHSILQLKASALSIQVKLSVVEKSLDIENNMESKMLLTKVFEVLEDTYEEEKLEKATDGYVHVHVGASTPKERAIEALSYMITITAVKEALVRRSKAIASLFQLPTENSSRGHTVSSTHGNAPATVVKSNVWYGLAYILYHTLSCESALKKKQMEQSGMDISPEQYEELQKALKQKSVLDDGDTNEKKLLRIQRLVGTDPNEQVFATLVHLLKTSSSSNVLEMATLSALSAAEEPSVRGKMVQRGVLQALVPLSISSISFSSKAKSKKDSGDTKYSGINITKETKLSAAHAMAKILISTNPNLVSINVLLSCIKPLLELCKGESQLMQFEALMALTNIASVPTNEMKDRIAKELSTLEYLQFSEHELVRRAATESICNLLPNELVIEKIFLKHEKVRLWLAFASLEEEQEDFETSRAAAGALAMVSQIPQVGWLMMKQGGITAFARLLEKSNHEETLHRAFFALDNIVQHLMQQEDQKPSTEANQESNPCEEAVKEAKSKRNEYEEELSKHRNALKSRIQVIVRSNSFQEPVKEAAKGCLATLEQAPF